MPTDGEERIRALGIWEGPVSVAPLKGGLSNESFVVTDGNGRHVVRFGADFPFHHVFRGREALVARAAAKLGLGPAVHHAGTGVMVSAFLGAKTFSAEDVRVGISRVAALVRQFHEAMPAEISGPAFMFWVFHVIRDYARTLQAGKSWMRENLPEWLALAGEMERAQVPLPIVFGHNDLLPANILDDGKRLWLIDFEYAGFSTAMFDLAGLSSNAGFSPEESDALLAAYFGTAPSPALKRSLGAMQVASLLREALWAGVSELHLKTPGVDFRAYAQENLDRLAVALDGYRTAYGKSDR